MEISVIPRPVIGRLAAADEDRVHLNILLSNALLLAWLGLAGRRPALTGRLPHACLFRKLLGIPCPGCGVTGSLLAMSRGDPAASLRHNPAGVLVFAFIVLQLPLRALALYRKDLGGAVEAVSSRSGRMVLAGLVLIWAIRLVLLRGGRRSLA